MKRQYAEYFEYRNRPENLDDREKAHKIKKKV